MAAVLCCAMPLVLAACVAAGELGFVVAASFAASTLALCCMSIEDLKSRRIPSAVVRPHMVCAACFTLSCRFCASGVSEASAFDALRDMVLGLLAIAALCVAALGICYALRRLKREPARAVRNTGAIRGTNSDENSQENAALPQAPLPQASPPQPPLIGGGDLRLMASLAMLLGTDVLLAIGAACILGLTWSAVSKQRAFPFGPCLALPATALAFARFLAALQWI